MGIRGGPAWAASLLGRGLPPPEGRQGGVSRPRRSGARAGVALPPPGAGSRLCPELGGADGRRAAWRCLRPRGDLWKLGFLSWGGRRGWSCLSFPPPGRGSSGGRLERSWSRGNLQIWEREVSFLKIQVVVLQRGGRLPGAGFPASHVFPSFLSLYKSSGLSFKSKSVLLLDSREGIITEFVITLPC